MKRKPSQEALIHESSSHTDHLVIHEKPSIEPPPPYMVTIRSSSDPIRIQQQKPESENDTSFNHQEPQGIPPTFVHIWSRQPTNVVCPHCCQRVNTHVETNSTIVTVLLALVLFFFCYCCIFLPFCISSCKRTIHYCPKCMSQLGEVHEFQ